MSSPYAGNPALFPATYLIPSDGDPRNAVSVNVAFEALGDRTAYLQALNSPATLTRQMRHAEYLSDWTRICDSAAVSGWQCTHLADAAGVKVIFFPVEVPQGSTIIQVQVTVSPGGPHPALPAGMPRWEMYSETPSGTAVLADSLTDGSATVGAYEANHTIIKTVSIGTVDNQTSRYLLKFYGEAGANSRTSLRVTGVRVVYNILKLDPGGS